MVGRLLPEGIRIALGASLASVAHRLFNLTYQVRTRGPGAGGRDGHCIYALWHGHLWHVMTVLARQGVSAMVSSHRDGRVIASVLEKRGVHIVRGSSTRGGARAALDFVRLARQGQNDFVVTVDGPRGPARQVKEGVLFAASRTGLPIVPVSVWVDCSWRLGTWDALLVGKPFARVEVVFGDELRVPAGAPRAQLRDTYAPRLERVLCAAEHAAASAAREAGSGQI